MRSRRLVCDAQDPEAYHSENVPEIKQGHAISILRLVPRVSPKKLGASGHRWGIFPWCRDGRLIVGGIASSG